MRKYIYKNLTEAELERLCKRPKMDFKSVFAQVEPIIDRVKREGDKGINFYNYKFDNVEPDPLVISPSEMKVELDSGVKRAIDKAFENISHFHRQQIPGPLEVNTMPGVSCKRTSRPIEKVGLYVPGGTAMLPSTLMMLGIPAMLAGCKTIVIATPPGENGDIADEIIYLAQKIGAEKILAAGGAQAIAGMAYGTESVPKVHKILGPGNQYVTAAKMMLQNRDAQIAIDMPAGPSEVLVIADGSADPAFVAADLLSQAEHGPDSQVVLVATPDFDLESGEKEVKQQLRELPRKDVVQQAIDQSFVLEVDNLDQAFAFSNQYAPEHLVVQCRNAAEWENRIVNAGSVFLGPWSPESAGDYASGTNHTLPTYGYAKMYSGVSVDSFLKFITIQQLTAEGLKELGPAVERLAELEKLEAHKRAVSIRIKKMKDSK